MSIQVGIYDLFAYTIPGLLYIYILNDALRYFNQSYIDWISLKDNLGYMLIIAVAAYVVGHLLDIFANYFCYRILFRGKPSQVAIDKLKIKHPKLDIQFMASDWEILFSILRKRDPAIADQADRHEANSIMLRNLSFGLFLFALFQLIVLGINSNWHSLILALGSLGTCAIAYLQSKTFHQWFFTSIFLGALSYGKNIKDVLAFQFPKA